MVSLMSDFGDEGDLVTRWYRHEAKNNESDGVPNKTHMVESVMKVHVLVNVLNEWGKLKHEWK